MSDPEIEGCQHESCLLFKEVDVPPLGVLMGTVPGGHNDTYGSAQYKFQSKFDKGLDAYKAARDEGLAPKKSTVEAVDEAKEEVRSQKRALKKMKKMGAEVDNLKTAPGVR